MFIPSSDTWLINGQAGYVLRYLANMALPVSVTTRRTLGRLQEQRLRYDHPSAGIESTHHVLSQKSHSSMHKLNSHPHSLTRFIGDTIIFAFP
jgi:hypothetical protein